MALKWGILRFFDKNSTEQTVYLQKTQQGGLSFEIAQRKTAKGA